MGLYQTKTLGHRRRALSVAGPTVWNSLPDELGDETENTSAVNIQRIRSSYDNTLYKSTFYLLIYVQLNAIQTHPATRRLFCNSMILPFSDKISFIYSNFVRLRTHTVSFSGLKISKIEIHSLSKQ